jgi:hypothetical protein
MRTGLAQMIKGSADLQGRKKRGKLTSVMAAQRFAQLRRKTAGVDATVLSTE